VQVQELKEAQRERQKDVEPKEAKNRKETGLQAGEKECGQLKERKKQRFKMKDHSSAENQQVGGGISDQFTRT